MARPTGLRWERYPGIARARHPLTHAAWVGVTDEREPECSGCRKPGIPGAAYLLLKPEGINGGMFARWCWLCAGQEVHRIHQASLLV